MFCRYCGKEIDESTVFCSNCGKKISENNHRDRENISFPKQRGEREISIAEVVGRKNILENYKREYKVNFSISKNGRIFTGVGEILGIMITIIGILAVLYYGISIDDSMSQRDYDEQLLKVAISIIVFLFGIILWIIGRNYATYAFHVIMFMIIVMAAVFLAGNYIIRNNEYSYDDIGSGDEIQMYKDYLERVLYE